MENWGGWRGQPCPVPAGRGGGRGRARRGSSAQLSSAPWRAPGDPGDTEGTRRDQGRAGLGGARALLGAAIPAGSSIPGLIPVSDPSWRGILFHSGRGRQGAAFLPHSPPENPPLAPPLARRGFGARSALPRMSPVSPHGAHERRGGSAVPPSSRPQVRPELSPSPFPEQAPGSQEHPEGRSPRAPTALGVPCAGIPGVRPPLSHDSRREQRGELPSLALRASPQLQPCPPSAPRPSPLRGLVPGQGGLPTHRLAPSRRCCAELRGCRRLFSCRFPLSHLPNKSKRGHRLAVSTHTLISGEAAGGAGGNGSSSPSGGAVASTGGWSGPGITRGNLERVLCRIPLESLSFRRSGFARLRLVPVNTRCSQPGFAHPRRAAPRAGPVGMGVPGSCWNHEGLGGAIKASPITATRREKG